jgi:hypothetical protein
MWDVITQASEKLYNERKKRKAEEQARREASSVQAAAVIAAAATGTGPGETTARAETVSKLSGDLLSEQGVTGAITADDRLITTPALTSGNNHNNVVGVKHDV